MRILAKERVTTAFAFKHADVDFVGPFKLRLSKSRGKGTLKSYVSEFICLSTKAIHFKAVEDYYFQITAFKKFTSRREHCGVLTSDEGTNSVGAEADLNVVSTRLQRSSSIRVLNWQIWAHWKLNPRAAPPHSGGIGKAAHSS